MTPELIVMTFSGPHGALESAICAAQSCEFAVEVVDSDGEDEAVIEVADVADQSPVPAGWPELVLIRAQQSLEPYGFRLRAHTDLT